MMRVAAVLIAAMIAAPAAATLCRPGEVPVFSCAIGTRVAAVCTGRGGPVYRFGRPGRVELTARNLSIATRAYSGGGETQISFRRGAFTYVVYDRTVRTAFGADGRNDPAITAGVAVRRGGRTISDRQCRGEATLDTARAARLPAGGFIEH